MRLAGLAGGGYLPAEDGLAAKPLDLGLDTIAVGAGRGADGVGQVGERAALVAMPDEECRRFSGSGGHRSP